MDLPIPDPTNIQIQTRNPDLNDGDDDDAPNFKRPTLETILSDTDEASEQDVLMRDHTTPPISGLTRSLSESSLSSSFNKFDTVHKHSESLDLEGITSKALPQKQARQHVGSHLFQISHFPDPGHSHRWCPRHPTTTFKPPTTPTITALTLISVADYQHGHLLMALPTASIVVTLCALSSPRIASLISVTIRTVPET